MKLRNCNKIDEQHIRKQTVLRQQNSKQTQLREVLTVEVGVDEVLRGVGGGGGSHRPRVLRVAARPRERQKLAAARRASLCGGKIYQAGPLMSINCI